MTTATTANIRLGRRMAEIRKRRRFTQEQLAARLTGIGKRQLQNYESGTSTIPALRIVKIADILGCNVEEFFKSPGSPIKGWKAKAADDMPAKENV